MIPKLLKSTKKKEEPKKSNINDYNNNIAQFIEDKNEPQEENTKNTQKEEQKEEEYKETISQTNTNINNNEKDKLLIIRNLIKSSGRKKNQIQSLLREVPWEERGKVELMAIDHKKGSLHIYNEFSNKIEEIKTNIKFHILLHYQLLVELNNLYNYL